MINIYKGIAPSSLVSEGEEHARNLCATYDADPASYRDGTRLMEVSDSICKTDIVRAELEACHFGKCCYCETVIPKPFAHSHIEHWRPTNSSRQGRGETRTRPGYYWLVNSWDNLLLSCFFCNTTNKSDLFPLRNPPTRARHHGMRLEDEEPGILKPDGDQDLRDHITFAEDVPVGLTDLGRKTIQVLGLDSVKHSLRREVLAKIRNDRRELLDLMAINHPMAREIADQRRKSIEDAILPNKPYSAMVAAFLATYPLPELAPEMARGAGGEPSID